jgi:hypothetical protein
MAANTMDLVRIRRSPETDRLGLSGKLGHVYGFTTPSVLKNVSRTPVQFIGELHEDYAESVYFEDTGEHLWFAYQLLEHLDHDPGLEPTIGGRRLFYTSDGRWEEVAGKEDDSP